MEESSEEIADVERKKGKFREWENLKRSLQSVADAWLATFFGYQVEKGKYESVVGMAMAGKDIPIDRQVMEIANAQKNQFFHWWLEFPEIFFKPGKDSSECGFDVIMGNPPYFNIQTAINQGQNAFWERRYASYRGKADVLYLFIERVNSLLKDKGYLGFIVANYFFRSHYADKLREFILARYDISKIADFGNIKIFQSANVDTCVIVFRKSHKTNDVFTYGLLLEENHMLDFLEDMNKGITVSNLGYRILMDGKSNKDSTPWQFGESIIDNTTPLSELCNIGKGVATGNDNVFVVEREIAGELQLELGILEELVEDSSIDKYKFKLSEGVLIRTTRGTNLSNYPNVERYLQTKEKELKKRYAVLKEGLKWFEIVRYNEDLFGKDVKEQIYVYYRSDHNKFGYSNRRFVTLSTTFVLTPKEDQIVSLRYLLALLNSEFMEDYCRRNAKRMGRCFEYSSSFIGSLPMRIASECDQRSLIKLVDKMLSFTQNSDESKSNNTNQEEEMKRTEAAINDMVCKIYNISEQKKPVEKSLKQNSVDRDNVRRAMIKS